MTKSFSTGCALRWKENLKAKEEADEEVEKQRQTVESHLDDCEIDLFRISAWSTLSLEQADEDGQRFHLVALRGTEIV